MNMGDATELYENGNPDDNARHYSIETGGAHDSSFFCTKRMLLICVVLQWIVLCLCIIIFAIHVSSSTADNYANYPQPTQKPNDADNKTQVRKFDTLLTYKRSDDIG